MPSTSPIRSALSLAQRYTHSSPTSTAATSAKKRAREEDEAILASSAAVQVDSAGAISVTEDTVIANVPSSPTDSGPAKKSKLEDAIPSKAEEAALPNEVARLLVESLSTRQLPGLDGKLSPRELLQLECESLHPSWLEALKGELQKVYFLKLKRFLWTEGVHHLGEASKTVFPPAREIYSWSRYTPLDKVRVVILGQDPYHNDGQAHGLAFSVRSNVRTPPSLKNIYKEVKTDYPDFVAPPHGYLGSWARQGVLLLNTCLTVRAHQANSHSKKGWEEFTDAVIKTIDARPGPGVVFLAWGQPALKRVKDLASVKTGKHLLLHSAHPSPLSASRGFFGNQHFKKTNEWLMERYGAGEGIDWKRLDQEEPEKPVE